MDTEALTAQRLEQRIRRMADPLRAAGLKRFFRTGPGEYGAGDRFLGLTVPQVRQLGRDAKDLRLAEIDKLLGSEWHEVRLLAVLLLANRYAKADAPTKERIYRLYLRRAKRINNWDLVDTSAPYIVGAHLLTRSRAPLRKLARSTNLWERRIAVVATQQLIREGDLEETLRLAELLMNDKEDLIHKAVGWMLREVGKRDEATLLGFLDAHAGALPRTTLRYAIERLSAAQRGRYMAVPRRSTKR